MGSLADAGGRLLALRTRSGVVGRDPRAAAWLAVVGSVSFGLVCVVVLLVTMRPSAAQEESTTTTSTVESSPSSSTSSPDPTTTSTTSTTTTTVEPEPTPESAPGEEPAPSAELDSESLNVALGLLALTCGLMSGQVMFKGPR